MTDIALPAQTKQSLEDGTYHSTILDGKPVLAQRGSIANPYISKEAVESAIDATRGSIKHIADILGCNRSYVHRLISGNPELRERLIQARESTIDEVEAKLVERALLGDMDAIKYYLRYQGRRRGYGDDSTANADGPLEANVNVNVRVLHAVVDAEQAKSIFDVLAGAGAIPALADGAEIDGVYSANADSPPGGVSDPASP